jgi:hypothetical protein
VSGTTGSSGPTGTTDTSAALVSGTITGFGSIFVDGVEYDDSAATVSNAIDPANPTPATNADLALGQQVELQLSGGKVAQAEVQATVLGSIDAGSINPNDAGTTNPVANSFTVLGQTVTFATSGPTATVFDGVTDATRLQDGQRVAVYGTVDDKGNVAATRIGVVPAANGTGVHVAGVVANANAAGHTFTIGQLTVDDSAATIVPPGATITDGEKVFVFSDQLPTGTAPSQALKAKTIRVFSAALAGKPVVIGGPISAVTPVAGQAVPNFVVQGIPVDASKATLGGGATAADVKVGAQVRVVGTMSGDTLAATLVLVVPTAPARPAVLVGEVTSYVSLSSFVVRGVPVDGSQATFTNGDPTQLGNGSLVAIEGHVASAVVVADRIAFRNPPTGTELHLAGKVADYDPAAGTFSLLGIAMKLAPTATFTGGTSANFVNGALVEVTGSFDSKIFNVTAVRFPTPVTASAATLVGTVSDLSPTTGVPTSFVANNTPISVSSTTTITNGPLADGQVVVVTGQLDPTTKTIAATNITVLSATSVHLVGAISTMTGATSFTIRGQAVDASKATFVPSSATAADLAVGKVVLVTGTLSNGVVIADTVRLF